MVHHHWRPTASIAALNRRADLLWRLRTFFHDQAMREVHTPILGSESVIDRHIDPVVLAGSSLSLREFRDQDFYLQTSPEFGMKRLLVAGMRDIYQISPVFRAGERGQFHNPEFTMVEWYRLDEGLLAATEFLSQLIRAVLETDAAEIETYQSVFFAATACDPLDCTLADLARVASRLELAVDANWSDDQDAWLDLIFSEAVGPQLGLNRPMIVTHYPASQSALARISADDPRTAERFELYMGGIELANGYHELLDAGELARRNTQVALERRGDGKPPLPTSSHLEAAMRVGLPACSGCALGFDRLLMVDRQANSIDEVIAFPIERA
ncbi:MAG: EF-P lysine aminoacylase EpmA [Pirellulaceae bacterium]